MQEERRKYKYFRLPSSVFFLNPAFCLLLSFNLASHNNFVPFAGFSTIVCLFFRSVCSGSDSGSGSYMISSTPLNETLFSKLGTLGLLAEPFLGDSALFVLNTDLMLEFAFRAEVGTCFGDFLFFFDTFGFDEEQPIRRI